MDKIDADVAAEVVRGNRPRHWEDVSVGETIQPIVRGPLTVADMIAWMMGVGSPHIRSGQYWLAYRRQSPTIAVKDPETGIPQAVERVHWDSFMAAEIGMPAPYDYGSQRGAWAHAPHDQLGRRRRLGGRGVRAIPQHELPGRHASGSTARSTDKWRGAKSGIGYVGCEFHGVNQRGDDIMPGTAVVALPSRSAPLPEFPIDYETDGRA